MSPDVSASAAKAKISVRRLDVFYGTFKAVKSVSVEIRDRAITALIGPSGCGKSTFLRCLNRLNDTIADCRVTGEIRLDGQDIYDRKQDVVQLRARVGMVFQKPNPFPKSVYENVAYGPRIHGLAADRTELDEIVQTSLQRAGLWDEVKDRLDRPGTTLSGGQQQRLCIARSLALEPEVLLLDEPTSGLDPISTGMVEESLFELKKQYAIVIVPHSVQQAARVADFAAFFLDKRLVEYGEGSQVFTSPRDKRTEDYVTGRFG